jgi:hypothetical protein
MSDLQIHLLGMFDFRTHRPRKDRHDATKEAEKSGNFAGIGRSFASCAPWDLVTGLMLARLFENRRP